MELRQQRFTGERALFMSRDLHIADSIFADGESPLKESRSITIDNCSFQWKYPLWYCRDIEVKNSSFFEMARAGIWYTHNVSLTDCLYEAPKGFRRVEGLKLEHVDFPHADEMLWHCNQIAMHQVSARGNYFGMNSSNIKIDGFHLVGDYSFDGCKNIEISNAKMISKDAFWNCENVIVRDSYISGEYLGWNSKNITFIHCTLESLQGFCYMENVVLRDCKILNTTLAFEYSTVDCETESVIDSIKNPISGRIVCGRAGELIFDDPGIRREDTVIVENQK
ncbi:MAG: DUF3737 family protein [Proteobacteria bacterium]|nr:DUF3737 family protein [Pseudomonadota bacterium]